MSNYNGGAGLNQQILNNLSKDLYGAVYPEFFNGKKEIDKFNIKTVSWDITRAPVFDLNPSEKAKAFIKEELGNSLDDSELLHQLEDYINESVVTFELSVPEFVITIETMDGSTSPPINSSISVYLQAEVTDDDIVIAEIIKAEIDIEEKPVLVWILNKIVLPVVEDQLNRILLKGIQFKPLKITGIVFSAPAPVMDNQTLQVFDAIYTRGATVPPAPGSPWPQDKLFILTDEILFSDVGANALKKTQKSITVHIPTLPLNRISATPKVGVSNPSIKFDGGSKLTVNVDASGTCTLKAQIHNLVKRKWNTIASGTIGISALPKVTGEVYVDASNHVIVKFLKVNKLDIKWDISVLPKIIKDVISIVTSALLQPVIQLIGSMLIGVSFPVYRIPDIPIDKKSIKIDISVSDIGIDTITDTGNKLLLAVTGDLEVKKP